jgi:hypothetical protein
MIAKQLPQEVNASVTFPDGVPMSLADAEAAKRDIDEFRQERMRGATGNGHS